jgi:hypothetical protein
VETKVVGKVIPCGVLAPTQKARFGDFHCFFCLNLTTFRKPIQGLDYSLDESTIFVYESLIKIEGPSS